MNFKLLTFVFVVIGVQSISSSIIRNESTDGFVHIGDLNVPSIKVNLNSDENPWAYIKIFTFNASDSIVVGKDKIPQLRCGTQDNDFCTRGNGKYQAKIVKCVNLDYGKENKINKFSCKLYGMKTLNKNVVYGNKYGIFCLTPFNQETSGKRCIMGYAFESSDSYDEADDVENKDQL